MRDNRIISSGSVKRKPERNGPFVRTAPPLGLSAVLERLFEERSLDFREYKTSSLQRRISKRLDAFGGISYDDYLDVLASNPSEIDTLFNTITVKVSEFFREPEVYGLLADTILTRFGTGRPLRAWCCGCANGEEAYSLAMMLSEMLDKEAAASTKVFATDIDPEALEKARVGAYREDFLNNVGPGMRVKNFIIKDGLYKVKYNIRNMVRFGCLDIVTGQTFTRIDILFCRNLFIYFKKELQEKVFEKLDYALSPGGLLVMGKAEVIPQRFSSRYELVRGKTSLYRKLK